MARISLSLALIVCLTLLLAASVSIAQDKQPVENDYYTISTIPTPNKVVLEVGAMQFFPDGKLAVSSRRGEIWVFGNPLADDAAKITAKLYASGLHEVLGLAYREGWLYATQRGEVSRLKDEDDDGRADVIETVSDDWEINGNYHEYAFGSKFDRDGNIWVTLCLTGSSSSESKYRGWCLRVNEDGKTVPTCSGIRSPGGMGMNAEGDVFYTDNQGLWNGTCSLRWLRPGSFQGHPAGNKWYELTDAIGERPADPVDGSRIMEQADLIPQLEPPCILFPYKKMGQSASGVACDQSGGKFGPFSSQMFVGDQTVSSVMRVFLEKVDGHYQGACFPFREGFSSGTLPIEFAPDGSIFVGGTNRGWGSRGKKPFALERMQWTGKVPFEIHEMHALPDGFRLTFTKPVDEKTARQISSYKLETYTYIYQSSYGSPEVDSTTPEITSVEVADDAMSVDLTVDGLQRGHVHELHLDGLRCKEQLPLLHPVAYYTLNYMATE